VLPTETKEEAAQLMENIKMERSLYCTLIQRGCNGNKFSPSTTSGHSANFEGDAFRDEKLNVQ